MSKAKEKSSSHHIHNEEIKDEDRRLVNDIIDFMTNNTSIVRKYEKKFYVSQIARELDEGTQRVTGVLKKYDLFKSKKYKWTKTSIWWLR